MSKKVIITGGSGMIGRRIAGELSTRGYELINVSRSPGKFENLHPYKRLISWDEKELKENIEGSYGVINLAGATIARRWTRKYKEIVLKSRTGSTRKLVDLINNAENPPQVLVNASTMNYYADAGDTPVDEKFPAGQGFLSEVTQKWEAEAKRVSERTRLVLCRIGLVLDPEGGMLGTLLPVYKLFNGGPVGSGRQWMSWIHIKDVTGIFSWALENENVNGPVNTTAPGPVRMNEFSKILGIVLHRPSIFRVPGFLLRLILGEESELVLSGIKVLPAYALENGYHFRFDDLAPALKDLLI